MNNLEKRIEDLEAKIPGWYKAIGKSGRIAIFLLMFIFLKHFFFFYLLGSIVSVFFVFPHLSEFSQIFAEENSLLALFSGNGKKVVYGLCVIMVALLWPFGVLSPLIERAIGFFKKS